MSVVSLLQLVSPNLPIGSYAYSQGLESAIEKGWVDDEQSLEQWLHGIMRHSLQQLDIPVLRLMYRCWLAGDLSGVRKWNNYLLASRESKELLKEDKDLGMAFYRVLSELQSEMNECWTEETVNLLAELKRENQLSYVTLFSLCGKDWALEEGELCEGFLWSWLENQVMAALKLFALGQTAGQRILLRQKRVIARNIAQLGPIEEAQIGMVTPGLAMLSSWHERQYSRLFRS